MFKEKNGKISFTRISGFIIILFYLFWGSYLVLVNKAIADIPVGLLTLLLGLYGINRFSYMFGNFKKEGGEG